MTFDEYQKLAIKTINTKLTFQERLDMLALGLSGESGEASDIVKKWRYHGHTTLDETKLSKEVGDCVWYCSGVAETLSLTLSEVLKRVAETWRVEWLDPFDPNDVNAFQQGVERFHMDPPEERGERPKHLSEVTHHLCFTCNSLAEALCECEERSVVRFANGFDIAKIVDVMRACACYAVVLGRPLEAILVENVEKLRARYPEGFSAERSLNRPKE